MHPLPDARPDLWGWWPRLPPGCGPIGNPAAQRSSGRARPSTISVTPPPYDLHHLGRGTGLLGSAPPTRAADHREAPPFRKAPAPPGSQHQGRQHRVRGRTVLRAHWTSAARRAPQRAMITRNARRQPCVEHVGIVSTPPADPPRLALSRCGLTSHRDRRPRWRGQPRVLWSDVPMRGSVQPTHRGW